MHAVTILSPPRHPLITAALDDARRWCAGHVIDERPALAHAARVAVVLGEHVPTADPQLIAAALLHDAPDLAPPEVDLDGLLDERYGPEVVRIVRTLEAEHVAMDSANPTVTVDDVPVVLASSADKIVALTSLRRRAQRSGDPRGFFAVRPGLVRLLPHFADVVSAGVGIVPTSMTSHLDRVLTALVDAVQDR